MISVNKAFSNMLIDRLFKTNLVVTMRSVIQYQYISNRKEFISVCSYLFCINWIDINLVGEFSSLKLHSFLTEVFSLVVAILQATNSRNLSLKLSQIYIQSLTILFTITLITFQKNFANFNSISDNFIYNNFNNLSLKLSQILI